MRIIVLQNQPQTRYRLANIISSLGTMQKKRSENAHYLRLFCTHLSAFHLDWSKTLTFSLTFIVYILLQPLSYNDFD